MNTKFMDQQTPKPETNRQFVINFRQPPRCFRCNKIGHFADKCPENNKVSNVQVQSKKCPKKLSGSEISSFSYPHLHS